MLTISSDVVCRDCEGLSRRDFIRIGTLGLGGLALADLLRLQAVAATSETDFIRDKAVVLVFLSGGASHIETFNPNMAAPAPYRSTTGEVQTRLPGVTFGGTFPEIARHAHHAAIVRSFQHPIGGHVQAINHVLTGGTDLDGEGKAGFSMGSVFARLRGANHPRTGLPTYCLLNAEEVDPQYRSERGRVTRGSQPGLLGLPYAPFNNSDGGSVLDNMKLKIPAHRLDDRRELLGRLDRVKREIDAAGAMDGVDKFGQQAVDVVLGGASQAFDLSGEDARIVERYDTSQYLVGKKVFRQSVIGSLFLTARRLIESGCGFITIHSAGWDMHADGNNPGIVAGMEMLGRPLDKALSAFLDDLDQRGLRDKVLTVITGDFGRTPKINERGGRDHWARLGTLAFFGGGLNMGQIVGQSTRNNSEPATEPIGPSHLMATIMHTLFDIGKLRLAASVPRSISQLIERGEPIRELIG